jgi:hypothetical protein
MFFLRRNVKPMTIPEIVIIGTARASATDGLFS